MPTTDTAQATTSLSVPDDKDDNCDEKFVLKPPKKKSTSRRTRSGRFNKVIHANNIKSDNKLFYDHINSFHTKEAFNQYKIQPWMEEEYNYGKLENSVFKDNIGSKDELIYAEKLFGTQLDEVLFILFNDKALIDRNCEINALVTLFKRATRNKAGSKNENIPNFPDFLVFISKNSCFSQQKVQQLYSIIGKRVDNMPKSGGIGALEVEGGLTRAEVHKAELRASAPNLLSNKPRRKSRSNLNFRLILDKLTTSVDIPESEIDLAQTNQPITSFKEPTSSVNINTSFNLASTSEFRETAKQESSGRAHRGHGDRSKRKSLIIENDFLKNAKPFHSTSTTQATKRKSLILDRDLLKSFSQNATSQIPETSAEIDISGAHVLQPLFAMSDPMPMVNWESVDPSAQPRRDLQLLTRLPDYHYESGGPVNSKYVNYFTIDDSIHDEPIYKNNFYGKVLPSIPLLPSPSFPSSPSLSLLSPLLPSFPLPSPLYSSPSLHSLPLPSLPFLPSFPFLSFSFLFPPSPAFSCPFVLSGLISNLLLFLASITFSFSLLLFNMKRN